jgi:hypothetical protein
MDGLGLYRAQPIASPERGCILNHSMGAIGNQADSIVSAVAEVYILAKYMPKMRVAIENKWEPFLQNLTRAA